MIEGSSGGDGGMIPSEPIKDQHVFFLGIDIPVNKTSYGWDMVEQIMLKVEGNVGDDPKKYGETFADYLFQQDGVEVGMIIKSLDAAFRVLQNGSARNTNKFSDETVKERFGKTAAAIQNSRFLMAMWQRVEADYPNYEDFAKRFLSKSRLR